LKKEELGLKDLQLEGSATSGDRTSGTHGNSGHQDKPLQNLENQYPLPKKYNVNKLMLQVKNPKWIHMYWEYTDERLRNILSQSNYNEIEEAPLILRVYDLTINDQDNYYDIDITKDHDSWYLGGLTPDHKYKVELGILTKDQDFYSILKSNSVKTPANDVSDIVAEEWMTVNEDLERIYILSGVGELKNNSSLDLMKEIKEITKKSDLRVGYSSL